MSIMPSLTTFSYTIYQVKLFNNMQYATLTGPQNERVCAQSAITE